MTRFRVFLLCIAAVALCGGPGGEPVPVFEPGEVVDSWRVPVPYELGILIERHAREMIRQGYAEHISPRTPCEDLCHGHILMKPDATGSYETPEAFAGEIAGVVYHTDELLIRWRSESPLPPKDRTPRSLVGWTDGSVARADSLVKPEACRVPEYYETAGSISQRDIADAYGFIDDDAVDEKRAARPVLTGAPGPCAIQLVLHIVPDPNGRFIAGGTRFDASFACVIPRTEPTAP